MKNILKVNFFKQSIAKLLVATILLATSSIILAEENSDALESFLSQLHEQDELMNLLEENAQQDELTQLLLPAPPTAPAITTVIARNNVEGDPLAILIQEFGNYPEQEIKPIDNNGVNSFIGPIISSYAAIIVDANNGKVLYQKNSKKMMPIASISKLMSAIVVLDTKQNLHTKIKITTDDIDRLKKTSSRLGVGTVADRKKLLHLGLMSSENRAIHALARNYPGGKQNFMRAMNQKAKALGMNHTVFYDPTGLDPRNKSTAEDLVKLAQASNNYSVIRNFTTSNRAEIKTAVGRVQHFKNSNQLVREGSLKIGLQKTGYIRESGRCMVVRAHIGSRPVIMVLLDAPTSSSRVEDAKKIGDWMINNHI